MAGNPCCVPLTKNEKLSAYKTTHNPTQANCIRHNIYIVSLVGENKLIS